LAQQLPAVQHCAALAAPAFVAAAAPQQLPSHRGQHSSHTGQQLAQSAQQSAHAAVRLLSLAARQHASPLTQQARPAAQQSGTAFLAAAPAGCPPEVIPASSSSTGATSE
jgi:hypothetical protein